MPADKARTPHAAHSAGERPQSYHYKPSRFYALIVGRVRRLAFLSSTVSHQYIPRRALAPSRAGAVGGRLPRQRYRLQGNLRLAPRPRLALLRRGPNPLCQPSPSSQPPPAPAARLLSAGGQEGRVGSSSRVSQLQCPMRHRGPPPTQRTQHSRAGPPACARMRRRRRRVRARPAPGPPRPPQGPPP
jgi:hypothetical protein